jgi:pimeloyl-ACP methyl ester carboxylesterase
MAELVRVRNCNNPTRRGDVVFVHGLNGNPRQYWFPPGEPDKFWPAWLGEDLPDVGVWSLGYENAALKPRRFSLARYFLQAGFAMPLVERAYDVLLRLELDGLGERPLVFIGHSMGGLLIKQLLRAANDSDEVARRAVLDSTRGVCFIATPHIGSDLARLAHYFGSLLGINVSVDELRPHHPYLLDLNRWYRNFVTRGASDIKTLTFYEQKPMPRIGLVVEPGDADPGIPDAGLHPLDENHDSICKPASKSSSIYQRVLRFVDSECLCTPPTRPRPTQNLKTPDVTTFDHMFDTLRLTYAHGAKPLQFKKGVLKAPEDTTLVVHLPAGATQQFLAAVMPAARCEVNYWANYPDGGGIEVSRSGDSHFQIGRITSKNDLPAEIGIVLKMLIGESQYSIETYFESQRIYN